MKKLVISLVTFVAIAVTFLVSGITYVPAKSASHHATNGVQILAIVAVWSLVLTIVFVIAARKHHVPRPQRKWDINGKMH